ncbi:hypothetical protein VUR80DRAFT_6023 [Thermomyces stellatus]
MATAEKPRKAEDPRACAVGQEAIKGRGKQGQGQKETSHKGRSRMRGNEEERADRQLNLGRGARAGIMKLGSDVAAEDWCSASAA